LSFCYCIPHDVFIILFFNSYFYFFHDDQLIAWDMSDPLSPQSLLEFKGHAGIINCMAVATTTDYPNGILVSGSDDQDVRTWDLQVRTERIAGDILSMFYFS
jgi:hypothetical protein